MVLCTLPCVKCGATHTSCQLVTEYSPRIYFFGSAVYCEDAKQRSSTELAQSRVSDTTLWWVTEACKPVQCTLPTMYKHSLAVLVNFEHFSFSRFLKVFPCNCWINFWTFQNFWCREGSKVFPGENTKEYSFSKLFFGTQVHSEVVTTLTFLD